MQNWTSNYTLDCNLNVTNNTLILHKVTSIPTFILGLLGNIYVFVIFSRRPRKEWTNMMIYITNMAIADSVVLAILPFMIHFYNSKLPPEFKAICNIVLSLFYVNMYVSIFTVTAISVVRYIAVKFPLKAREILSRRSALVVCGLIWLVMLCFCPIYFLKDSGNDKTMCFQRVKESLSLHFILLLTVVGFLLPFLIVLFCSIKIICTLRKRLDVGHRSEKLQCMFIIAANLIVFVICFLPIHFGFILKYIAQSYDFSCDAQVFAHNFVHVAMFVSIMNCGLDSFCYYFATKTTWNICGTKVRNEASE
ncbi:G-protein coupled receptor 35.1 [Triplophysa dalaica]|uniref:G-protein coupled receptor 35.1 n=1 Tax=Triplophysa dalaica TaxID=1582913 RepID=UPI0024DFC738|nr:G-protein coupled receptor 35.1 [Triplophysa dalaica]XP_056615628.1 G-protein coupled receptor 35.1 [Triplophysa dalaica]XP_056615629.1 G-protein coupled receptor 35.1 [Triplophysa dalaica]XP_056615630.1 G-protein coupled receptor 35.1 [Triplophysa dalaica]XP_056615631.1 G-protein coupled receptor 35.1 [Triplophysa dalaica]